MGRTNGTIRSLRDQVIEAVACKSGILLVDSDVYTLLTKHEFDPTVFDRDIDQLNFGQLRSEEFYQLVIETRRAIGNLPDNKCYIDKLDDFNKLLKRHRVKVQDFNIAHKEMLHRKKYGETIGSDQDILFYEMKLGVSKLAVLEILIGPDVNNHSRP